METSIPSVIVNAVSYVVSRQAPAAITAFTPSHGGCINNGGHLHTTAGDFFLKWNKSAALKGMFEAESKGLILLRSTHAIHIPEVIATEDLGEYQYLLIEYVEQQPGRNDYWQLLGEQLAALHRIHGPYFGLDHDNYIGSLFQSNRQQQSWSEFFISQRLEPLLIKAINTGKAPLKWQQQFAQLFNKLESMLPQEPSSLLHGDLWQGNVITNTLGAPCLIDPAVYYGHREVDIAMTKLFGEFDTRFYEAYQETYPLSQGSEQRFELYNLYPLLVHLLLFGTTYATPIQSTLNRFV